MNKKMRDNLAHWRTVIGGQAYNILLASLRKQIANILGTYAKFEMVVLKLEIQTATCSPFNFN